MLVPKKRSKNRWNLEYFLSLNLQLIFATIEILVRF